MATTDGRTSRCLRGHGRDIAVRRPSATTSKSSGHDRTTSRVWVPIDPVEPSTATEVVTGCKATASQQPTSGRT